MSNNCANLLEKSSKKEFKLQGATLSLAIAPEDLFIPNTVTVRFSRAMPDVEEKIVYDIGSGVCPLGILAGLRGARAVYCVDPVEGHAALARHNVESYGLEGKVHVYQGTFCSPLEGKAPKADLIIGDVSGIAEIASRALGWYPPDVPTGGDDGTETIIDLIDQAPGFLAEGGMLLFPVAIDLSDSKEIMYAAGWRFNSVVPCFNNDARFVLTEKQVKNLHEGYSAGMPHFINIHKNRDRYFWRGQIYAASNPKE